MTDAPTLRLHVNGRHRGAWRANGIGAADGGAGRKRRWPLRVRRRGGGGAAGQVVESRINRVYRNLGEAGSGMR